MTQKEWIRHLRPILHRFPGQHDDTLFVELEKMSVQALERLYRIFQHVEQELNRAKRTYRPFPGGPALRF